MFRRSNAFAVTLVFAVTLATLATASDYRPSGDPDGAIIGPIFHVVKGVGTLGIGTCHSADDTHGIPGDCDNDTTVLPGRIVLLHSTSFCTSSIGCIYDVWGIQSGGTGTGFGILVCTDRNDLGNLCTDVGEDFDDISFGHTGVTVTGQPKSKENGWAFVEFCVRPDAVDANGDGAYDVLSVYIASWTDEDQVFPNEGDNTGTGLGTGIYDIYIRGGGAAPSEAACADTHDIHGSS